MNDLSEREGAPGALPFTPVIPERIAIARRIAMAKDEHQITGGTIAWVMDGIAKSAGAAALGEIRTRLGIEEKPAMLRKYPARSFLELEQAGAKALEARGLSFDDGVFTLGASTVNRFLGSPTGKMMRAMAVASPHLLFSSCISGYRILVTFGERSYQKTGSRSGVFTFQDELLGPLHNAGVFRAAIELVYQTTLNIELAHVDALSFRFELSW